MLKNFIAYAISEVILQRSVRCIEEYSSTRLLTFVLLNPDIPCLCKQCFWRSQLIWICTVCHYVCEFIATIWIKWSDWLKIRSGSGILIYSAGQGLKLDWFGELDAFCAFFTSLQARQLLWLFMCFHENQNTSENWITLKGEQFLSF